MIEATHGGRLIRVSVITLRFRLGFVVPSNPCGVAEVRGNDLVVTGGRRRYVQTVILAVFWHGFSLMACRRRLCCIGVVAVGLG